MRKFTRLSCNVKREILDFIKENKDLTSKRISDIFSSRLKKRISRRTISDLKLNENKILQIDRILGTNTRISKLRYAAIDGDMLAWVNYMESCGVCLNDDKLISKSNEIAECNGIIEFKSSNGWLQKFKKRNSLKLRNLHGEAGSTIVDLQESINIFLSIISLKLSEFNPENVYNADETGVFYKTIPSKSVCREARPGFKMLKEGLPMLK